MVTPTFTKTATVVASCAGVRDLKPVEYPGAIMSHSEAEIKKNVEEVVIDRIVEALTKPVGNMNAPKPGKAPDKIVFKGTAEEVNEFFYKQEWSDGLPIVPPTEEKVEEFLKYTDLSPDEIIAVLPQANLRATPRNIAINAIMAGCRPEYLPLLIAAVKAISEPDYQLMNIGTTGCIIPWLLVNGPIVKQLGLEFGVGLASRGPNPVIGRGFSFIVRNIAGFRPGETLMGTWGYFPMFVLAEDDDSCDEIGWNSYHVEHGFEKGVSTVTARATMNWGPQVFDAQGVDAKPILDRICENQKEISVTNITITMGPLNMATVLITPPVAKVIARNGYSKRDVAQYVWENTTMPRREVRLVPPEAPLVSSSGKKAEGTFKLPERFEVMGPDEMVPIFATGSPEIIDIIVCGDKWRDKVMNFWTNYHKPVAKKIEFPAAWAKLLAARKD